MGRLVAGCRSAPVGWSGLVGGLAAGCRVSAHVGWSGVMGGSAAGCRVCTRWVEWCGGKVSCREQSVCTRWVEWCGAKLV